MNTYLLELAGKWISILCMTISSVLYSGLTFSEEKFEVDNINQTKNSVASIVEVAYETKDIIKVIDENLKIIKGNMTTIHAYTNDQATLDITHKKGILERRGRACAMNMVPTSTGAASAIGKVLPNLSGRILGSAIRVPVSDGSLIDLVLEVEKTTSINEINDIFKKNMNETLNYTEDPIVSSDIISSTYGATVDGNLTNIIEKDGKQLLHIIAWYDNEMGYSYQMVRTLREL